MQKVQILLVEDNEGDILLTKEAFEEARFNTQLSVVKDGKAAIDFLCKREKYMHAVSPDIVLLDVNLPKKNGHEVLNYMKSNDGLKHIPVIMLTTSSSQKDIDLSYSNHVNCYITKPTEVENFMDVVATIENFWMSVVKLPNKIRQK